MPLTVLGINEDVTTCECCGKAGLKLTVILSNGDGEVYFGRDCAARAIAGKYGRKKTAETMEKMAREADRARMEAERRKVHEIGEVRSVRPWVIESIGCNGGSITVIGYANGLRPAVVKWAEERWPNLVIDVRIAI